MNQITFDANIENIEKVSQFINEEIKKYECSNKTKAEINIAIDELFGNIAKYAYKEKQGKVTIKTYITDSPLALNIIFIDNGIKYNPLEEEQPDITLSSNERKIGGLGILVTKSIMDDIKYKYENRENILEIKKELK